MKTPNITITAALNEAFDLLERFKSDPNTVSAIEAAGDELIKCLNNNGAIYSCGNGGSMSDSMHLAEEFLARFRNTRPGLRAIAISDPAYITCAGNDFGYEAIFSRYLEACGRSGDVLVAFSTSGKSPNILAAAREARARGMRVIALTGAAPNALIPLADVAISTPTTRFSDRVQELHIKVVHILVELVEQKLFPGTV